MCAYLCLRAACSASAAGAQERGHVPSVFKGFSGVCSGVLWCLSRVNKNKSPNHVSASRDPLDLQEGKHKTKKFYWEMFLHKGVRWMSRAAGEMLRDYRNIIVLLSFPASAG